MWQKIGWAPRSSGLVHYVLDREVGGSNPGDTMSYSTGHRLDLPILVDKTNSFPRINLPTLLLILLVGCLFWSFHHYKGIIVLDVRPLVPYLSEYTNSFTIIVLNDN